MNLKIFWDLEKSGISKTQVSQSFQELDSVENVANFTNFANVAKVANVANFTNVDNVWHCPGQFRVKKTSFKQTVSKLIFLGQNMLVRPHEVD